MKRLDKFFLNGILLSFILSLSGCILIPFIDSFHQTGVTESDRQTLLTQDLKRFSNALAWGSKSEALAYATEDGRKSLFDQLKDVGDSEHIVESKVVDINFSDSAYKAVVELNVRYYKVPVYTVQDKRQHQTWEFALSSGWKLTGTTLVKNG